MFATLIGPYPPIVAARTEAERLTAVLEDQLEAGLGMLTDGRVHRVAADPGGMVRAWRAADAVGHHLAAERGLEPPLVKACLLGPWSAGGGDPTRVRRAAAHLGATLVALFDAGAPVVQLNEPGISGVDASDADAEGLLAEVLGALAERGAGRGHLSLAVAGGDARVGWPAGVALGCLGVGFASYLLDPVTAPDDWAVCARVPGDSGLVVGVVDARRARAGAMEVGVWGARYAASMRGRGPARTGICPSAGVEHLDRGAARALLAITAEVARKADLPDRELVGAVDPLAVDARSGALGRGMLRPRPGSRVADR